MRSSVRQDDGGNANDLNSINVEDPNSGNNMEASFDCELDLSTNYEPTSFEEVIFGGEWKESIQNKYDSLIKNGTWKLLDPPFRTK